MTLSDGAQQQHEDEWTSPEDPFRRSERSWTGRTEIRLTEVLEEMQASAQFEESAPFDSAPFDDTEEPQPETPAMEAAPSTPAPATPGGTFRRRRPKTRQLQRGFWIQFSPEPLQALLERTHEWLENRGGTDWQVIPLSEDVGRDWMVYESANAELQLILASTNARKLRKPQPFASPLEAPLGKSSSLLKTKLGQTQRHGAIWNSIIKKLIWSSQLAGKDHMTYAAAANQAKHSLIRKSGFSPYQWVLGKSIRLPTDLTDESEICSLGASAQSMDEGSKYFLKTCLFCSKKSYDLRDLFCSLSDSYFMLAMDKESEERSSTGGGCSAAPVGAAASSSSGSGCFLKSLKVVPPAAGV